MTVPEILYQRALDAGFTLEAICSLLANIQGESAFRSDNAEDRINRVVSDEEYIRRADAGLMTYNGRNFVYDEVGFGYAQWTFWSRKQRLLDFCKARGTSVADHESQKEFIFDEMQKDFPGIWQMCRTSHDMQYIMQKLIAIWENPADHDGAMRERWPYAQAWYAKFSGWTPPIETTPKTEITDNTVLDPADTDEEGIPVEKTWPPRTIQNGLNWPEVYLLQALLRMHGYNVLVNGIFNDALTTKVKEYQTNNKLASDGIVGPKTWKSLMALPSDF